MMNIVRNCNSTLYLIDGIEVSPSIFTRRQIYGESPSSRFVMEPRKKSERTLRLERHRIEKRERTRFARRTRDGRVMEEEKGEIWHTIKPSSMRIVQSIGRVPTQPWRPALPAHLGV
jgi:hypothetical protein